MKTFIERTFPVCEPFLDRRDDGRWVHPLRQKPPSAVLLSVCGFPEESAFGALSHCVNLLFEVWMDIITDKADGTQMFMQGKYSAEDDASMLLRMDQWFS